mmetsp:Transcript_6468/g.10887  ORF Transcript_6468/g.10887 Transcript_6468/m.10887 type:complete len:233 (-) Transcript_6468:766-1464(-)
MSKTLGHEIYFPFLSSSSLLLMDIVLWSLKHCHSPNTPANIPEHAAHTEDTPPDFNRDTPTCGAPTRASAKSACSIPKSVPFAAGPTRAVDSPVIVVDSTYWNILKTKDKPKYSYMPPEPAGEKATAAGSAAHDCIADTAHMDATQTPITIFKSPPASPTIGPKNKPLTTALQADMIDMLNPNSFSPIPYVFLRMSGIAAAAMAFATEVITLVARNNHTTLTTAYVEGIWFF